MGSCCRCISANSGCEGRVGRSKQTIVCDVCKCGLARPVHTHVHAVPATRLDDTLLSTRFLHVTVAIFCSSMTTWMTTRDPWAPSPGMAQRIVVVDGSAWRAGGGAPDRRPQATPKPLVPGMVHSKSRGVAKARPDDLDGGAMRTRLMETHPKAPPPKILKTAKPFEGHCRYFNFGKSPDGCRFGASCKFSHATEDNWDEIGRVSRRAGRC